MAHIETWKSRGGPPAQSGNSPIPWPYYMGTGDRAMAQFGATLEDIGTDLISREVNDKATEELNDLDINLLHGWDNYQNWARTNPNTPDLDGSVFKQHAEQWNQDFVARLSTTPSRQTGSRTYATFVAEHASAARAQALKQQHTNAAASFAANVEWLKQWPKQPVSLAGIEERQNALALAYDRAAQDGLTDPKDLIKNLRTDLQALWKSAALNAIKYGALNADGEPEELDALLFHPDNPLDAGQIRELHNLSEDYATLASDSRDAARLAALEKRQDEIEAALRAGDAEAAAEQASKAPELADEKATQQKWLDRAVNSAKPAETTPAAFNEAAEAQLQGAAGERKPGDAREAVARLRFDDRKLSPDDYAQIRSWQDVDPVTAKIMLGAIDSVKRQVKVGLRHLGLFQADTDKTLAATTRFIAERAAQAKESGKPLDPADLDQAARQFAAAQGQQALKDFAASAPPKEQDIDITGVPAPQAKAKPTYPQMRRDTPPELRARIKRLIDAGADPEEVFNADEVKPYVLRGQ